MRFWAVWGGLGCLFVSCTSAPQSRLSLTLPARLFELAPDAEVEMGLRCAEGPELVPAIVTLDADNAVDLVVPPCGAATVGVWIYAPKDGARTLHWLGFSDVELVQGESVSVTIVAEKVGEVELSRVSQN